MPYIKIKLISDLCVSSGEIFQNNIDTEVCFDSYGFPNIPAKRIKGCLRERAEELKDWGILTQEDINTMFGEKGKSSAKIQISNAYLENYDNYINDIKCCDNKPLIHPQNILQNFTYTRTQTSIDSKTGIAKETSLRISRVIKKDLIFNANITLHEIEEKEQKTNLTLHEIEEKFEKCCKALRRMGVARTRGLGEVRVSYHKEDRIEEQEEKIQVKNSTNPMVKLEYTVKLDAPILLKSAVGGQEKTQTYIEGSKLLGEIARRARKQTKNESLLLELIDKGELICSNAYISEEGKRYEPMQISIYKEKGAQEVNTKEGKVLKIIDRASNGKEDIKRKVKVRGYYIHNKYVKKVVHEIRYHHRRGEDKGIGRSFRLETKENDSEFYQLQSMSAGQEFTGYILIRDTYKERLQKLLNPKSKIRIGYGKSVEYGECTLRTKEYYENKKIGRKKHSTFLFTLNAPVILYNEFGMYSTEIEDLRKELEKQLSKDKDKIQLKVEKKFLNYTRVGGYNYTWNLQKPTFDCIDMGSICVFAIEDGKTIDINDYQNIFLGERNTEGFGEGRIFLVPDKMESELCFTNKIEESITNIGKRKSDIIEQLELREEKRKAEELGIQVAENIFKNTSNELLKIVVEWMLRLVKESENFEKIKNVITYKGKNTEKSKKIELAEKIYEKSKNELIKEEITPTNYTIFMLSMLLQLRYKIRAQRGEQK